MQIDTEMLGIIVTVLIAVIGLAAALGALSQKVKQHDKDIYLNREENRQDHRQIFDKLEEINKFMRNGNGKLNN